jgi:hypothetical protein
VSGGALAEYQSQRELWLACYEGAEWLKRDRGGHDPSGDVEEVVIALPFGLGAGGCGEVLDEALEDPVEELFSRSEPAVERSLR